MVIENQIPKTEMVYELKDKYEVPSFEEFMKTYENDGNLNFEDLSDCDIGTQKGYGPCYVCSKTEHHRGDPRSINRRAYNKAMSMALGMDDCSQVVTDLATKQVRDNLTIKRTDIYRNHKKLEETLSTHATGIDANNCPEKLKHYLFGVNEILEGRGGKILKDAENRERDVEMDSPEYLEQMSRLFTNAHSSMRNEREVGKSLEGKTHTQINIESKFGGGNAEQGEQVFNQISSAVTRSHNSFRFYPQKEQQSAIATEIDGFGGIKKQELVVYFVDEIKWVIREFKENPGDWKIGMDGGQTYLIHNSAQGKDKIEFGTLIHNQQKFTGSLIFNSDAMIRVKDLNKAEQKAVGYNKSEQRLQEFSLTTPQKNDNKISTGKVFGVIGIIGVLLFASVAILRKRLNNKIENKEQVNLEEEVQRLKKKLSSLRKNRKQVRDNLTIKRTDIYRNHKKLEETLSTHATGIDANNCPEKLKHYLFGVNEILEDQFLLQNNTNTKNILLVGYTGNGKSTLANVLTGTDFFREGGYCVGETKNIKSVEFKCEGSNYRIIDTPGFGDTSLTEKEILNKIAEAVHEARDGITQIFFIIGGRFSKAEIDTYEAVYKLFSKAICDENVAKYITIVRTHFKDFKNEGECQTDINLMLNDHGELSEIITEVINEGGKGKIIHVDNDTFQLRTDSRKILLDRLQKCRGVYKPESIDELNRKISGSLREKQDLLEEVNLLKREIDNLKK
ncbi:15123_t:CDS:10 [Funneliformis geosporum]|nr:15123_t:CDS:10 [Funneliformis geosporum]